MLRLLWTGRRATSCLVSDPALDIRALLFTRVCSRGLLCGLAPAYVTDAVDRCTERGRGVPRRIRWWCAKSQWRCCYWRQPACERSRRSRLRRGFNPEGVLSGPAPDIPLCGFGRPGDCGAPAECATTAGIDSAAVNRCVPFTGCSRTVVSFTNRPNDREFQIPCRRHRYISADYFKTLGIPLLAGRLTPAQGHQSNRPAVAL